MTASDIIFHLLASMTLAFGALSVTTRQLFRAAIYLLFTLIGIAGLYFWMEYEFIAAVQIVVYVGGIVVLIIFSILLTQQAGEEMPLHKAGRRLIAAIASFCGLALVMMQVLKHGFTKSNEAAVSPDIKTIGGQLLQVDEHGWALPFEVISILLLAAMVGCIVIAIRQTQVIDKKV